MSDLYRFDVDYIDEEQGIKHIPSDHGDYVLAEDALKLQKQVAALEAENTRLNAVLDSIWTRCYEFIANEINDQQFIQETGEYARTRGVDE